jgi:hypothetical protein
LNNKFCTLGGSLSKYSIFVRDNARAVFNEQTEDEFHNALYDDNSGYRRLVRFVFHELISQGLFIKEERGGRDPEYVRTSKLIALCPQIAEVTLPVIDDLVSEYERQHPH